MTRVVIDASVAVIVAERSTSGRPADCFATSHGCRSSFHPAERWTDAALELALRHGVTVHDGLYLALAAGNGYRLVTADRRLHEACREGVLRHLVEWIGDRR